jgi:phospholipid/cholesterol/gamma-HCH transport system substrate-binding protein
VTYGREVVVGLIIIVSALVGAIGTLWLKGTRFGETVTRVDVLVRDVGQLMEGNEVTFRGVSIGRVTDVRVEQGGNAVRVSLELEGEVDLARDAVVIIAPESLFGDWQAEIVTKSRFPRYSYYEVEEGRTEDGVPVLGGYALPDISRLTATAEAVSENLAELTDRVERAFNEETATSLQTAIGNIEQVSEDIKNLIGQQASTFENVSQEVERAATEIGAAAEVGRGTMERVDELLQRGEIDSVLVNLTAATGNMERAMGNVATATQDLQGTLERMDSTFARVDRVAMRIEQGEGSLGRLLSDTALYARAEAVLSQLDTLLVDIQENPRRYIRLSIF